MNLESSQVYGGTPYTNPPDHPAERKEEDICNTAPFPWCNNAEGCDTCEYQKDEE